jgi:hypothetical protein
MIVKLNTAPSPDPRWADTKFLVEATSTERFFLWLQNADESTERCGRTPVEWRQDSMGAFEYAGYCDDRPVTVNVLWATLNGIRIAFYEAASELVDHRMVNDWINLNFSGRWDGGTRRAHCDAMNFHHCLDYIRNPESR